MVTPGSLFATDMVLFDVAGFSLLSTADQHRTAILFSDVARNTTVAVSAASFLNPSELVVGFVPTGDGFYVILDPAYAGYGVFFALSMRNAILIQNHRIGQLFIGVRCAVNHGEAIPFRDLTNGLNFVGDGMNDTARLLGAEPAMSAVPGVPSDSNYVVASRSANASFRSLYGSAPVLTAFLTTVQFQDSQEFQIVDKHGKTHDARFVETKRHVALQPPKPANLSQRLSALAPPSGAP